MRERRSKSAPPSRRRPEAPRKGDVHNALHEVRARLTLTLTALTLTLTP